MMPPTLVHVQTMTEEATAKVASPSGEMVKNAQSSRDSAY